MKCTYRRRGLASLVVSALILGSAALARGADFELPALNSPPSAEHHPGKMVWADLVTPDLAAAEKFYGATVWLDFSAAFAPAASTMPW